MASQATASPEARQEEFEQAVALSLHLWPDLTVAVQNNWSEGNNPEDVRDWFAGAVVDLFPSFVDLARASTEAQGLKPPPELEEPEIEDVESRLLQVMADEYNVDVDDDSSLEVAQQIMRLRASCAKGEFEEVEALRTRWSSSKGKKVVMQQAADPNQDADDDDWEDEDDDDDDDEEDEDDGEEAPALVPTTKEKPEPEVDEDGFTKVTRRKR